MGINDSIAKQAALADSRFKKTVKDIAAARKEAASQVKSARKDFATDLAVLTSSIKSMETRLQGDISVVAGEVARIEKLMNDRSSESKKARGKLRAILDENKRAPAAADSLAAKKDLTAATENLY